MQPTRWTPLLAILVATVHPSTALAQDSPADPQPSPPSSRSVADRPGADQGDSTDLARYTLRPLTLPQGTVRSDLTYEFAPLGPDFNPIRVLNLGASFGILDDLEFGFTRYRGGRLGESPRAATIREGLVPIVLSEPFPDQKQVHLGDISPYLRGRFFHSHVVELGAEITSVIPTSSTSFRMRFELPVRFHFGDALSLDTGVDADLSGVVTVPLKLAITPVRPFYLAVGAEGDFAPSDGEYLFGVGAWTGYAFDLGAAVLDVTGGIDWPQLVIDSTDFYPGVYEIDAGARILVPTHARRRKAARSKRHGA